MKPQSYRLYKMKSASQWELSYKEDNKYSPYLMFLTVAAELPDKDKDGNSRYDWDNGIRIKLGLPDIGEILCVLDGRKDSLGTKGSLYHASPDGGSKVINLNFKDGVFDFSVSRQDKDKNNSRLYHRINDSEAIILSTLLKSAITTIMNW